jgi:hypothetical protein
MSPDFIPHSATQNPPPSNLPPTTPKFHDINPKCSCPGASTVITVVGISCKRTLELCPLCPASTVFLKLCTIISHDQKESWIPASVIDIATVGFGGQYLGRRFQIYVPEPNKPSLRFWRRTVRSEPDLESKHDPAIEVQLLAGVLLEMAEELRTIELRLLRGRGEVVGLSFHIHAILGEELADNLKHAYRIIAVVMITVVVLLAVACAWLKDANPGIAAGGYWLQSILCEFHHSVGNSKNVH